jgi:molybdopterin converting factor small subunit
VDILSSPGNVKNIPGKVQLRITPSISSILNAEGGWLTFEREIRAESTIGDFLADLAISYPDFKNIVFNPDTGRINDLIQVVVNDTLIHLPEGSETTLKDGDKVVLVPVYTGG